ncbi:MAG: hypothetical protein PHU62_07825 [Bacteroidales bacterium]|jgi:hypothetical protein|nr:hypothetical protein [Bacteroidales bacterium]MDD2205113.1 hypothetical protein [Bacteroidales bacterium]MDD3152559.1 hypothetical protein [Bacteroidales bacterium]MDD3914595.1 hypothetical protein [Bacteroidales bacterium]MDD4634460.1 hypothetical protein [Bacteroidales bacterium]
MTDTKKPASKPKKNGTKPTEKPKRKRISSVIPGVHCIELVPDPFNLQHLND